MREPRSSPVVAPVTSRRALSWPRTDRQRHRPGEARGAGPPVPRTGPGQGVDLGPQPVSSSASPRVASSWESRHGASFWTIARLITRGARRRPRGHRAVGPGRERGGGHAHRVAVGCGPQFRLLPRWREGVQPAHRGIADGGTDQPQNLADEALRQDATPASATRGPRRSGSASGFGDSGNALLVPRRDRRDGSPRQPSSRSTAPIAPSRSGVASSGRRAPRASRQSPARRRWALIRPEGAALQRLPLRVEQEVVLHDCPEDLDRRDVAPAPF